MPEDFNAEEFVSQLDAANLSQLRALLNEDPFATMIDSWESSGANYMLDDDGNR